MAEGAEQRRSGSHLHTFLLPERDSAVKTEKGVGDADGIVESPERVDRYIETAAGHPLSHRIREAAAHDEDLFSGKDPPRRSGESYWS